MVYSQTLTGLHALMDVVGPPGNLLVLTTIFTESRFHIMPYILLASLATSDFLLLILGNSFNIASSAQESWLYSETMCTLHIAVTRCFYSITVLHLIAVSHERYSALVKSLLTHNGSITASRVVILVLIWGLPVPLSSVSLLFNSGYFFDNQEVQFCKTAMNSQLFLVPMTCTMFVVPFMIIIYLNWRVLKTENTLQINPVAVPQLGSLEGSHLSKQEQFETLRIIDRKSAVDFCIIITTFSACYLPVWTTNTLFYFKSEKFSLRIIPITRRTFYASSIIYSIRKREFRAGAKKMLGRIGRLCGVTFKTDNTTGVNSSIIQASLHRTLSQAGFKAAQEDRHQNGRLFVETPAGLDPK